MFVGSEGLFGIALEITLRLLPKPEVYFTLQAAYDSLAKAGHGVSLVIASGLLPGAMEIMDRLAMDAADAAIGAGYPPDAQAVLIVELEGPREEVEAEKPRLWKSSRASGASERRVARDEAERLKSGKAASAPSRRSAGSAPTSSCQDGVVPRSRLGEALGEIEPPRPTLRLPRGQRVPRSATATCIR